MLPVRTALIGFGKAGEWLHAPFIQTLPEFQFHSIIERSKDRAKTLYPSVQTIRSVEEIWKDQTIELVVIATPNNTHAVLAEQAMKAGKHVVVDKPFTITAAEARHLSDLSSETGKKIVVYQNRRWDGDFLTVQTLLRSGLLGEITSIESRFDRYRPEPRTSYWKESNIEGNGLFYDLGPHLMDQAFTLFGKPEDAITEIKIERKGAIGIDYMDVCFQYPSMTYRIHADMMQQEPTPRWHIKGSEASFIKYGVDPQEARLSVGGMPAGSDWGVEDEASYGHIVYPDGRTIPYATERGDWRMFYMNVYDAIRNNKPFPVTLESSVELVEWMEKLANKK
ncbi:MAG: Gfo/Idh/MocA family oxidoreductase [Cytophagales bacterium]|nr:Gfo/Idh/MocA family oxidoreductase [Cytophaga sp.]